MKRGPYDRRREKRNTGEKNEEKGRREDEEAKRWRDK